MTIPAEQTATRRFGVDLITFYHPDFWGVATLADIDLLAQADPAALWSRILDAVVEAGISEIEMTFPPADWNSALAAFGSATAFAAELASRGLRLKSGFHLGFSYGPATDRSRAAAEAAAYAEFIRDAGGDTLVVGPPMRRTRGGGDYVDVRFMSELADVLHHVGEATLELGIRTAVHTEAHSVFCTRRDVDLLMALTDPMYVFMCPDTGHIALSGSDPTEVMQAHHERMILAHWKDTTGAMPLDTVIDDGIHVAHREYFRRAGAGAIDWSAWDALVSSTPSAELTLLELDAVADPVAEMQAAISFVRSTLDSNPVPVA